MSSEVGFAVVGLGMGKHHCRAISSSPGARLVAVCDLDTKRLEPTAAEFGCKGYEKFEDLLADPEVQVVNMATPSGLHSEMGIMAVEAGKHLIVEKPADIVPDRIDSLIEAGRRCKVKIGGIFQSRLDPLNIRIREAITSGRLGSLVGVHGHLPWYRKQSYYEGEHGSWKGTWNMDGGGSLMNQGVHTVDLLQWLVGPVESVMGMFGVFGHDIEAEDQTVGLLRFKCGAIGTLFTTTCCYPGYDQQVTIYGSQGSIVKQEGLLRGWKIQDDPEGAEEQELLDYYGGKKAGSGSADPMAVSFDGHTQIVGDMVKALAEDRAPMVNLDSARHAVEIITAIYESGRSGREIKVGES
jgi:UDP-N-acetyl-2-amino-2-deoxyglucuronate dehydrogenase